MSDTNVIENELLSDEDFMELNEPENEVSVQKFTVKEPHWRVSRQDFLRLLDVISKFPTNTSVYLAVRLKKEGDISKLQVVASNKDYYLCAELPVINETGVFDTDRVYFFQDKSISTLVKAYTDFVFLFDDKGDIYYYNTYVKHKLEAYSFDIRDFYIDPPSSEYARFDLKKSVFQAVKKLLSLSVRVSDSKALVKADTITGFMMLFAFDFQLPFKSQESFYLRRLDFNVLSSIYVYEDLEYQLTKDRIWVSFPLGLISFLRLPVQENQASRAFSPGETIGTVDIDLLLFRKAMNVSTALGDQVVTLYNEERSVMLKGQSGNSVFKIGTGDLSQEFKVSLEVLRKTVASLPEVSPIVSMEVTTTGLIILLKDSDLVYRTEISRISTTMMARKEKTEGKKDAREERKAKAEAEGKSYRPEAGIEVSSAARFGVAAPKV